MFRIPLRLREFYGPGEIQIAMPGDWPALVGTAATLGRDVSWMVAGLSAAERINERAWRSSMLRVSLREAGPPNTRRLDRTYGYSTLDPSEKGSVSFFLGQTCSKYVAEELLGAVVFVHLDTTLRHLGLPIQGTRPDFLGFCANGQVLVVESKGRSASASPADVAKAKASQALAGFGGVAGLQAVRYASMSYFTSGDRLRVLMEDPPDGEPTEEPLDAGSLIASHYAQYGELVAAANEGEELVDGVRYLLVRLGAPGVVLGFRPDLLEASADLAGRPEATLAFLERLDREWAQRSPQPANWSRQAPSPNRGGRLDDPSHRQGLLQELRRRSIRNEEQLRTTLADGTLVFVDERWTAEVMALDSADRPRN